MSRYKLTANIPLWPQVQLKDPWTADKSLQSGQLNMQNMAFFLRANTKANIHLLADLLGAPVQFLLNANI